MLVGLHSPTLQAYFEWKADLASKVEEKRRQGVVKRFGKLVHDYINLRYIRRKYGERSSPPPLSLGAQSLR